MARRYSVPLTGIGAVMLGGHVALGVAFGGWVEAVISGLAAATFLQGVGVGAYVLARAGFLLGAGLPIILLGALLYEARRNMGPDRLQQAFSIMVRGREWDEMETLIRGLPPGRLERALTDEFLSELLSHPRREIRFGAQRLLRGRRRPRRGSVTVCSKSPRGDS